MGIMLSEDSVIELHHFDATDDEAFGLKASKYTADDIVFNRIGFKKNQRSFSCHGSGSSW